MKKITIAEEKALKKMFKLSRKTYYSGFSQQDVYEYRTLEDCLNKLNEL